MATRAAAATAALRPRKGRARPLAERSVGSPDPGAVSFALIVTALADQAMSGPAIIAPMGRSRGTAMDKGWRIVVGSDNAGVGYKDELKACLQRDPRVASVDDVGVGTRADGTAYGHWPWPRRGR